MIPRVIRVLATAYVNVLNRRPLHGSSSGDGDHEAEEPVSLAIYPFF